MTKVVIGLGSFSYLARGGIGKEGVATSRKDMETLLAAKIAEIRAKSGTQIDCRDLSNAMMALKFNNSNFDFDAWISKRELKYLDGDEEYVLYPQCWKGVEMLESGVFEFDGTVGEIPPTESRDVVPSMEDILLGRGPERHILEIGSGRCKHVSIKDGITTIVEFDNSDLFGILDKIKPLLEQLDWWYSWGGWLDWLKYLMYGGKMEEAIDRIIGDAVCWLKTKLGWTDETWDGALIFATAKFREYPKIDKIRTLTDLEEANAEYISAMESSKYLAGKDQYPEISGHDLVGTIGYGNMSSQGRCLMKDDRVVTRSHTVSEQASKVFTSQFGLKQLMASIGVEDVYGGNTKHTFVSEEDFDVAINRGYDEIPDTWS
jgi:hypothetical protein